MAKMDSKIESICEEVVSRNPGEPEFHQAVREVVNSLGPVLEKHPEFVEAKVIERLCEADWQIMFRVPWQDDEGKVHVNRGFRVQFSSALGPYKGGLRFHHSVYLGTIKFLGFEQTLKDSLIDLGIGGGYGGSDFDPNGKSDHEVTRFCQSFVTEVYRHIGEGANMPSTPEAVRTFLEAGVAFGPAKAVSAGGVAVSALEMQQNAGRQSWTFEYTDEQLKEIMKDVHDRCREAAEEYGTPGNYQNGANIAGFFKVARAMIAQGVT